MKFKIALFIVAIVLTFSFTCFADELCSSCGLNAQATYVEITNLKLFGVEEEQQETLNFYEYILEQCFLHNEKINVYDYKISYDEIIDMCFDIAMKYPQALIYTDFEFEVTYDNITYSIIPKYVFESVAEDEIARKVMDDAVEHYLNLAERFDDPLEKLLAVHDELVEACDYVKYGTENINIYHHAYSLLANNIGVCQAYSQAFYVIATELGYEVDYCVVHDDIHDLHHSWNYIKIDGEWYHIDVTHDDRIIDPGTGDTVDHGYHNHFLCSDDKIHEGTDYTYSASTWANYLGEHFNCSSDKYESHYIFNMQRGFDLRFREDGKICAEVVQIINDAERKINFVYDDLYINEPMIVSEPEKLDDNIYYMFYEPIAEITNPPSLIRTVTSKNGIKTEVIEANNEAFSSFKYFQKNNGNKYKYMLLDLYDIKPLSKAVVVE